MPWLERFYTCKICGLTDADEICDCTNNIQKQIGRWSVKTFPDARVEGLKNHLARELAELLSAKNFENHVEECADMAILLFGIAYRDGFDLLEEVKRKMEINRNRKWGLPDCDGVISHVD